MLRALAVASVLLFAAEVRAEETAEESPKVQKVKAVERGLFLETDAGIALNLIKDVNDRSYGVPAPVVGLFAGYDILEILNLSVGLSAMAISTKNDPADPAPRGDIFFLMPQLRVQFAVLTTERNFVWVRAHGGFAFGLPGKIDVDGTELDHGGNGPAFGASVGFERFTKLRHFSIGLNAGIDVLTKPDWVLAISIVPMVKYTF